MAKKLVPLTPADGVVKKYAASLKSGKGTYQTTFVDEDGKRKPLIFTGRRVTMVNEEVAKMLRVTDAFNLVPHFFQEVDDEEEAEAAPAPAAAKAPAKGKGKAEAPVEPPAADTTPGSGTDGSEGSDTEGSDTAETDDGSGEASNAGDTAAADAGSTTEAEAAPAPAAAKAPAKGKGKQA